jgi:hypothetical protein
MSNGNGKSGKFKSDHIYLVAYLMLRGHEVISTERPGRFTVFNFKRTSDLDADVADFHAGGLVPAKDYVMEVLRVKRFIPRAGEMEHGQWKTHEMAR